MVIVSRLEMVLIIVLLKEWVTDMPWVWRAEKVQRGKGEPVASQQGYSEDLFYNETNTCHSITTT